MGVCPQCQQIIAIVESEYSRRQIAQGGLSGSSTSTALYTNPQGPSASKRGKKKKEKVNHCTNEKCKYRHTHDFKDCRSEGGPQHSTNPLPSRNQPNTNQGSNKPKPTQGGRNLRQLMRANVAQDTEDTSDVAFCTIASFSINDIAGKKNPSERIEIYDSGATCHMSPYINAFSDFEFISPKPISSADNQTFDAIGKGNLQIKIPNGENITMVTLRDALYAPTMAFTLISLSRADKAGYSTVIENGELNLVR